MSFSYDPTRAAQVSDNDVLPAGEYIAIISDIEDKETKAGNGNYLKVDLTITEGKHKNWKVTDIINYRNANSKAEDIGWRTLKKIAKAIYGKEDARFDAKDLINKKIKITTKVEEDGQYTNARIKSYSSVAEGIKQSSNAKASKVEDDEIPF